MIKIRSAEENDAVLILQLIRDLAEYEKAPEQAVATLADIRRHGFGPERKFQVLVAEWENEPAGFALYFYHYSTWMGKPTLFLEDLFVRPPWRKRGIGKALLTRLAQIAVAEDCGRMEWQVLSWNAPAIKFYESLGAAVLQDWLTMRVSVPSLRRLAAESSDAR